MESQNDLIISLLKKIEMQTSQIERLNINMASLLSKMEYLEKMAPNTVVPTKRNIKVASTTTTVEDDNVSVSSATASAANTSIEQSPGEEKVINAVMFFKKIVICKNYNNLRDKYKSQIEAAIDIHNEELAAKPSTGKKTNKKAIVNSDEYWYSIAQIIYKKFDKPQTDEVRSMFVAWKAANNSVNRNQLDSE